MDYKKRINICHEGGAESFTTVSGLIISLGYSRVCFGGRGPYIEFKKSNLLADALYMPQEQAWRIKNSNAFYLEYRTIEDYVKIYYQRKTVSYADYKIGLFYVSPFDLYLDGNPICRKIKG